MPSALRAAAEAGIDARALQGTGVGGRVTKADVEAKAAALPTPAPVPAPAAPAAAPAPQAAAPGRVPGFCFLPRAARGVAGHFARRVSGGLSPAEFEPRHGRSDAFREGGCHFPF